MAQAISKNGIRYECHLISDDLVGEIIASFNQIATNLRQMVSRIGGATNELDSNIHELAKISTQSQESATQQQKAPHAMHTIDEISHSIQQVTQMATDAAYSSRQVDQQAKQGALIATIGSISALTSDMDKAKTVITQLDQKSTRIGMVVDVIHGIAEQSRPICWH